MITEIAMFASLTFTAPMPGVQGLSAPDVSGVEAPAATTVVGQPEQAQEMRSRRSPFAPRPRSPHSPPART